MGAIQRLRRHDTKPSLRRIIRTVIIASVSVAVGGCGNDESSASSEDIWLDAGGMELVYDGQIRMDVINAGKDQFAADKSCAAMLSMAQKSLIDSSSAGMEDLHGL